MAHFQTLYMYYNESDEFPKGEGTFFCAGRRERFFEFRAPYWFLSLEDARAKLAAWREEYNTVRPHSALGYRQAALEAWLFASVTTAVGYATLSTN